MAVALLEWCTTDANKQKLSTFVKTLFQSLQKPLISSSKKRCNREILWRDYFLERSSEEFIANWITFLKNANVTATPIFYQHLNDVIFRALINSHFVGSTDDSAAASVMTDHEASALRYAAGYVCRHLRKKIEHGSHELKEELVLCLMALVRSGNHKECENDEEWTMMMDRGGL